MSFLNLSQIKLSFGLIFFYEHIYQDIIKHCYKCLRWHRYIFRSNKEYKVANQTHIDEKILLKCHSRHSI
jgi:hypothetical protein